jgi:hypothetical protein
LIDLSKDSPEALSQYRQPKHPRHGVRLPHNQRKWRKALVCGPSSRSLAVQDQQNQEELDQTPPSSPAAHLHGTVTLDATRVGRDAGRIAEEVIAHLSGLVGAKVTVTLEVEAEIPSGAPDNVVRTVTENSRTLKFTSQGFEKE